MEKSKEKAFRLGLAVYRVTKLLPAGEVLITQIREAANQVLSGLVLNQNKEARRQTEVILNFLRLARSQNWIKPVNFDILIKEYAELMKEVAAGKEKKKKEKKKIKLTGRQKKILDCASNFRKFQTKDLIEHFKNVNIRTLRRDLEVLDVAGFLERSGWGRKSYYSLPKNEDTRTK